MVISSFLDRLVVEIEELQRKANRLENFLATDAFKSLSQIEQDLLTTQFSTMVSYFNILKLRHYIATTQFNSQNPENINS